jgi:hypothetical protein
MYAIQIFCFGAWSTVQEFATLEQARNHLICYQVAEGTGNVRILYPN